MPDKLGRKSRPVRTLRSATTYRQKKSIYASPSVAGSTSSLGRRLIVRRTDSGGKGKARAVSEEVDDEDFDELAEDDDEHDEDVDELADDEDLSMVKAEYRERAERAWETRRENERIRAELREQRLVSPALDLDLPSDDLLNGIHFHASKFYTAHSLILKPQKQVRRRQWGSKKRMLLQTEGIAPIERNGLDKDFWVHLKPIKRRRVMSVPSWAVQEDDSDWDEQSGSDNTGERTEETGEEEEEDSESQAESHGRAQPNVVDLAERRRPDQAPKRGYRKQYKQRDMFKSLDGTALLAMGFLVERFIARELARAGYQPKMESADRAASAASRHHIEAGEDDEAGDLESS
ncbi:hypothetical protein BD324DRAFT_54616 [Kockovaella imperatae]|uniref:Uncharacterized protein n=1 Tax=Kockovaella imperatae TaxID=4999 RepID=A0A1Y1UTJ5_9TREE|nr:hypothetical protein BD324DRAFT_54616 [Kockovaella imperatae]ORX41282.1 hypothetical protein BD324DRAFT_54616 [Kockovaella imperatae]